MKEAIELGQSVLLRAALDAALIVRTYQRKKNFTRPYRIYDTTSRPITDECLTLEQWLYSDNCKYWCTVVSLDQDVYRETLLALNYDSATEMKKTAGNIRKS